MKYVGFFNPTSNDLRCLDSFFPYIRKLFIQLNTGLPSSTAVERLFSLGGRVLTPIRTQLSDQRFESLVFLDQMLLFSRSSCNHVIGIHTSKYIP